MLITVAVCEYVMCVQCVCVYTFKLIFTCLMYFKVQIQDIGIERCIRDM